MSESKQTKQSKRVPRRKQVKHVALFTEGPVRSLSLCPVTAAVHAVMNTSFETKDGIKFDLDVVAALRGAFGAGKVYSFDMVALTSVGSTAGGSINQAIAISPGIASYQEWPALSALFDECNLHRSQISFQPQAGSDGQNMNLSSSGGNYIVTNSVMIGANYTNLSTAPTSIAAVARLSKSTQLIRCVGDSGVSVHTFKRMVSLPWAQTSVPAVQSPPSGLLGTFDVASAASVSGTTIYYYVTLRTVVNLRCRS